MSDTALQNLDQSPQVPPQVEALINVMSQELNKKKTSLFKREDLQKLLKLTDKKSFTLRYLKPALQARIICMTLPEKPTSRLQQYQLTSLGKAIIL